MPEDTLECRCHQEWFAAHINESRHGPRGVVGVKGREHEVTSERSLNRDLRGLQVTHLPHEDTVGVLTEECSQDPAKRQADRFIDRHLHDPVHLILDRIFRRE